MNEHIPPFIGGFFVGLALAAIFFTSTGTSDSVIHAQAIEMSNGKYNETTGEFEWIDHSGEGENAR